MVGKPPGQKSRATTLLKEVNHLKRVLAEKTLEVDFFRSALQKVEARHMVNVPSVATIRKDHGCEIAHGSGYATGSAFAGSGLPSATSRSPTISSITIPRFAE